MIDITIGAANARMLEIANQIQDTFAQPGEHTLSIYAEDIHGYEIILEFSSDDTDRTDWFKDLVVVETDE